MLEASLHDAENQRVSGQLIALQDGAGGISMYPVELRYIWPSVVLRPSANRTIPAIIGRCR